MHRCLLHRHLAPQMSTTQINRGIDAGYVDMTSHKCFLGRHIVSQMPTTQTCQAVDAYYADILRCGCLLRRHIGQILTMYSTVELSYIYCTNWAVDTYYLGILRRRCLLLDISCHRCLLLDISCRRCLLCRLIALQMYIRHSNRSCLLHRHITPYILTTLTYCTVDAYYLTDIA